MQLPTDCVQHVASQGHAPLWQKTDHTAPKGCLLRLPCLSPGWLGKGGGGGGDSWGGGEEQGGGEKWVSPHPPVCYSRG